MNANSRGEGPGLELPPQPEHHLELDKNGQEQGREAAPARQEQTAKQPPQPVLPAIQDIPAVDQPVIAVPAQDVTAPVSASDPHSHAADGDHIESQWIEKAKAVIAQTQDDPFAQKSQMSKVKAEYIQKRFGKQIKTDEAPA
ncbi:MAG TPA: hypothetical protein VFP32_01540 [Candidatus Saccharimonadales bacterium]|nr:hypothetical protein [Candidatus Saccharimonadales bacterium]